MDCSRTVSLIQAANLVCCVWAFVHLDFFVSFIDSWCPEVWASFLWYTDKAAAFLDKAGAYAIVTSTPNSPEYDEIETCKTSLLKAFDQLKSWWSRALSKFIYMFPLDWNLMGPLLWLRQESQVGALLFFPECSSLTPRFCRWKPFCLIHLFQTSLGCFLCMMGIYAAIY
jgi:hypothetical protein